MQGLLCWFYFVSYREIYHLSSLYNSHSNFAALNTEKDRIYKHDLASTFVNHSFVYTLLQCLYSGLGGNPINLPNMLNFLVL